MEGGAWWAAVYGVAQSRTRLSNFTFTFHFHALEKEMETHCSVLAWRIQGTGEPGGLPSMGSHRVGHDWSDLAVAAAAGLGGSISSNPERTAPRRWGEDWGYIEVLQQRSSSLNIKRLLVIKENQVFQVKEFSTFLCMCVSHAVQFSSVAQSCPTLCTQSCPNFATPWTVVCQAPLSMGFSR